MNKPLGTNEKDGKEFPLYGIYKWEFYDHLEYFPGTTSLSTGRPTRRGGWRGMLKKLFSIRPAIISRLTKWLLGKVDLGFFFGAITNKNNSLVRGICWYRDWFIRDGFWYVFIIQIAILYGLFLWIMFFQDGIILYWIYVDGGMTWVI